MYFTQTKIQNNVYKYIIIINNTLENIGNWLKAKKMALNEKKSNLMLFNIKKNFKSISEPNIKIYKGNDELEYKETAKCLGVYFDKRLS